MVLATRQISTGAKAWLAVFLLDRTGNRREHIIGVGPDQSNCSNDDDQDDRQHYGIFGDILSLLFEPKPV
jgi:hypothetical protein